MIKFTPEQLAKAEAMLAHLPGEIAKVLARAINRAAEAARAEAIRAATARYNVKAGSVRKVLTLRRANAGSQAAAVSATGKRIPLIEFKVSPNQPSAKRMKRPHRAAVLKGGGMKDVPGMFVARLRNGRVGAFSRTGKERSPIREHFGPSIPEMLGKDQVSKAIEARAQEILESRLEHEIARVLEGGR